MHIFLKRDFLLSMRVGHSENRCQRFKLAILRNKATQSIVVVVV